MGRRQMDAAESDCRVRKWLGGKLFLVLCQITPTQES